MAQAQTEQLMQTREQDAFALTKAAVFLDQAKQNIDNKDMMTEALMNNFMVWATIRETVSTDGEHMPEDLRSNLLRISEFVMKTSIAQREAANENTIDTLININFNISEGLLTKPQANA